MATIVYPESKRPTRRVILPFLIKGCKSVFRDGKIIAKGNHFAGVEAIA